MNVSNLTLAGWLLALFSIGVIVLVSIPIGQWALEHIDRAVLREWISWIVIALSLAGLIAGVTSFAVGQNLLERCGIRVRRSTKDRPPGRYDDWILWAVIVVLNLLVWAGFFLFA